MEKKEGRREGKKEGGREEGKEIEGGRKGGSEGGRREDVCSRGKQANVQFLAQAYADGARWSAAGSGLSAQWPRRHTER